MPVALPTKQQASKATRVGPGVADSARGGACRGRDAAVSFSETFMSGLAMADAWARGPHAPVEGLVGIEVMRPVEPAAQSLGPSLHHVGGERLAEQIGHGRREARRLANRHHPRAGVALADQCDRSRGGADQTGYALRG